MKKEKANILNQIALTLTRHYDSVYYVEIDTNRYTEVVALQEFADIAGDERGLLGIGIGSTRGHMLLPEAIAEFRRGHPGVDVRIREGENDEVVEDLRTGRIDLAIATIPEGMAGIEARPLRREQSP